MIQVRALIVAALSFFAFAPVATAARIAVTPRTALVDAPVSIRVTGLPADHRITLTATTVDSHGNRALTLRHTQFERRPLNQQTEEVLKHVTQLWGFDVVLQTVDPQGEVGRLYSAKTTPHMFVINPAGVLIYDGAIDDKATTEQADIAGAKNYVSRALEEAAAGKPVSTPTSRPYGCSVKYAH